jgi:hypothetical protein
MSDWTSGYIADIGYTFGYYAELQPLRMKLPFAASGLASPDVKNACELGYGQGLSTNIHAAASGTQWWGTDFNPAQAGFAQELARASGAPAHLFDQSFEEFCSRTDLPDFDFIALHGIWSWISDANREVIADFVRRKLKVGGVLYISYNTLPGWAPMVPLRHLLTRHADVLGVSGEGIGRRIDGALDFADALLKLAPGYTRAAPGAVDRLQGLRKHGHHYLAHEYFNRDWHPMHFLEMADWLAGAKLGFACSAHYADLVEGLNLTGDQQAFLRNVPDPLFREAVRDFMVNAQFRRDYWVKGVRTLNAIDRIERLRALRVLLVISPDKFVPKVNGAQGESNFNPEVCQPVLEALADHKVTSIGDIEARLCKRNMTLPQILQSLVILASKSDIVTVQDDAIAAKARPVCERLNMHLMERARGSEDIPFLASPLTGGSVMLPRAEQMFLLCMKQGAKTAPDIAARVWEWLKLQGHSLQHDGRAVASDAEAVAHLQPDVDRFLKLRMPLLRALLIA